jgi:hypothetical protein
MKGIEKGTLAWNIMNRESTYKIDFSVTPESKKVINQRIRSFFQNPEKGMGPKRAAAIVIEKKGASTDIKHSEVEDKVTKKLKGK